MSWLCLDTHVPKQARIGLLGTDGWIAYRDIEGRANRVLFALAELHRGATESITGVCVVEGPGSFSSIRTGVLYANLYARLQKLPLVGISPERWQDERALAQDLFAGRLPIRDYLAPVYDQEPNITIPTPHP
ncbi:hypothetical protein KBA73_02615 [Patescibacteria group bacterium]|nr:hypothetical protein [Patescibacteria group bacterium]